MKLITKQTDNKPLTITIEYPTWNDQTQKLIRKIQSFDLRISARCQGQNILVSICDIYYLETVERKTFLYTETEVYRTDQKLCELEKLLEGTGIIRISRFCLMNMDMLYSIRKITNSQLEATLTNGEKLIVARTYLGNIRKNLKEISQ